MIKPSDKKVILSVLGKRYSQPLLEYLAKKGIMSQRTGEPLTVSGLTKIMNGQYENLPVEDAIIQFVALTRTKKAKQEQKRREMLRK